MIKSKHLTMFEQALMELGILYHRIQIATPRHNGKVERQHRIDEERFYKHIRMYSLKDGRKQLRVYQRKSNNYIKTCLGMKSPNMIVRKYQGSYVLKQTREAAKSAASGNHYITKKKSRSGSIPYGNLLLYP